MINRIIFTREMCADPVLNVYLESSEQNLSKRYLCYVDLDGEVFSADFNYLAGCFSLPMNKACNPFLAQTLCVSAYVYDFIKDEKQDAKWQEFERNNFDYIENTPLAAIKDSSNKNWKFPFDYLTDGNEVISVSGPVDKNGKYLDIIDLSSRNYFFAKPKYNRYTGELLKIKWAYAYYDKNDDLIKKKKNIASLNPFCYQMTNQSEAINNGLNQMDCNFHNDSNIAYVKVYAFFNTPSENASVQIVTNNEFANVKPKITDWYWCDRFGDKIDRIGYDSEIFICIESKSCKNKALTISVFDQDSIYNDPVTFTNNNIILYANKSYIEFPINKKRLQAESGENDSELFFTFSAKEESIKFDKKQTHKLKLVQNEEILSSYFAIKTAKELVNPKSQKKEDIYYSKINKSSLGSTIYVVSKILNSKGKNVKNIIYKNIWGTDPKIPILKQGKTTSIIESEVDKYGLAVSEIKFKDDYGTKKDIELYINSTIKGWWTDQNFIEKKYFSLSVSSVDESADEIIIISEETGEIKYNIKNHKRERVQYIYLAKNGEQHNLGTYKLKKVKNLYTAAYGDKIAKRADQVYLLDVRNLIDYTSPSKKFKLKINTSRYFLNDVTTASLFAAMLDCSFEDFVFNGFSNEKGESIGGSKSHKNGVNGDLRYLRLDKKGGRTDLFKNDKTIGWKGLDEDRQSEFNEALYKYGWKSMLSQYYNGQKILVHCTNDKRKNHNDHLHIQGYKPELKMNNKA